VPYYLAQTVHEGLKHQNGYAYKGGYDYDDSDYECEMDGEYETDGEIEGMMELLRVASNVRFDIKAKFRQENIVIAFPQRDVHLDTKVPFKVKIIEAPDDSSKKK